MAVRKLVIIVQHGEKEPIPGDPGLTATGRRQANCAGRWISERFSVEGLWTSPLRRAAETASEVARWTGSAVRTDERLRERTNWTGPGDERLEDFLAEWRRCWIDSSTSLRAGILRRWRQRFLAALDDLRGTGTVTVAVAHSGVTVDALGAFRRRSAPCNTSRPHHRRRAGRFYHAIGLVRSGMGTQGHRCHPSFGNRYPSRAGLTKELSTTISGSPPS